MKSRALLMAWLLAIACGGPGRAAEFPPAWKFVKPFKVEDGGWQRFDLPLDVLDVARPGLEDLRVMDDTGREVPFALDRPKPQGNTRQAPAKFSTTVQARSTVLLIETGVARPLSGLILETPATEFLKAARLEGSRDGKNWDLIGDGLPVFRQRNGTSRLQLAVPPVVWPFLRITLDDQRSGPIPVTGATLQLVAEPAPANPVDVQILSRTEGDRETRLNLRLPAANLVLGGIELEGDDVSYNRFATLLQSSPSDGEIVEESITRGRLRHSPNDKKGPDADSAFAADVSVGTREVTLVIQNEDNQPLVIKGVRVTRRPAYVTLQASSSGTLHLLAGNAQCPAPRYDLEQALGRASIAAGDIAFGALALNPAYRLPDPLAAFEVKGAELDLAPWHYRKRIQTPNGGIQKLDLDLDVLAHSGSDFGDLRLMNGRRQVPYLLQHTTTQMPLVPIIEVVPEAKLPSLSRWKLTLPHANLPLDRLTCETTTPLFRRSALLYEERADERGDKYRAALGEAHWERTPDQKSGRLVINFATRPGTSQLWLEIDNGDNPPLALGKFIAWYPATCLLFKPPETGELHLYYGQPKAGAPHYDLALVASRILSAEKNVASLGPEELLHSPGLGGSLSAWRGTSLLWVVMAAGVAGLLYLVSRLLPKDGGT